MSAVTKTRRWSLEDYVRHVASSYRLPGNPEKDVYCVPTSGGADSAALAILMLLAFPILREKAVLLFTDTCFEDPGIPASLAAIEAFLGREVARVVHPKGLKGLVMQYNGFLPSSKQRWCTRQLKTEPYEAFVKQLIPEDGKVWSFVGIRADEPTRLGLISKDDRIETETPFIDLSLNRDDVFHILTMTIGVPELYRNRTRSACKACWGMRQSEVVLLQRWRPADFAEGMALEKISANDAEAYAVLPTELSSEVRVGENHLALPIPDSWEPEKQCRGRRKAQMTDLFGRQLFVAAEFFVNPAIGAPGVWWSDLVAFSGTLTGLRKKLAGHYWHRNKTAEVWGLTPQQMKEELKLVIYQLQLPPEVTVDPPREGFTWRQGEAFAQVKHVMAWAKRTLQVEQLHRENAELNGKRVSEISWLHERRQAVNEAATRVRSVTGSLVAMEVAEPPEVEIEDEREITCLACSVL